MSALLDSVQTLFQNLETDELAILQPILDTRLQSTINDPTLIGQEADLVAIEGDIVNALPQLAGTAVKDVAKASKTLIDTEAAAVISTANNANANNGAANTGTTSTASTSANTGAAALNTTST